jgi:type III restriction enzyme
VGRGLRLCVDQFGDRMDHPSTVHQVNVLTVVTSESYTDFVTALQKETRESLSQRPRQATVAYFTGKIIRTDDGEVTVSSDMANLLHRYLIRHDFVDQDDAITQAYHDARERGELPALPPDLQAHAQSVFALVDSVCRNGMMPGIEDGLVPKVVNHTNKNFERAEFQELWQRINRRSVYAVDFDSGELVKKAVRALDSELHVSPLQYLVERGIQADQATLDTLNANTAFLAGERRTDLVRDSIRSQVHYDLVGKLAEATHLRRQTAAKILSAIAGPVFSQFKTNPEDFLSKAARIVNEQKATVIVEHIAYHARDDHYDSKIFTEDKRNVEVGRAFKAQRHILDYVFTDSDVERKFVEELDQATEVVVYAKLPKGFFIPTPVGDYTPDWAIAFQAGMVKHVFFVAETKGDLSSLQMREVEKAKIECAKRFFAKITSDQVRYDVVDSYSKLRELVG